MLLFSHQSRLMWKCRKSWTGDTNKPYLQTLLHLLSSKSRYISSTLLCLSSSSSSLSNLLVCKHSGGPPPPGAHSPQHGQHLQLIPCQSFPYHQSQECAWCVYLPAIRGSKLYTIFYLRKWSITSKWKHPPLSSGCNTCHQLHSLQNFGIWRDSDELVLQPPSMIKQHVNNLIQPTYALLK